MRNIVGKKGWLIGCLCLAIFIAISGTALAKKIIPHDLPPPPKMIPIDTEKYPPVPYDFSKYSPQPLVAKRIELKSRLRYNAQADNVGVVEGGLKYAEGAKVLVIVEDGLSAALKPLIEQCDLVYQDKVGASVIYYELNLVDGAYKELKEFIASEAKKDPTITKTLVFTKQDIIPRFETWEDWHNDGEKLLYNYPVWILYFWDLDSTYLDTDGNGILDTRVGGTVKLEMPVMIYQMGYTPLVGSPEEIATNHIQNYLKYASGALPMDLSSAVIYDEVGGSGEWMEPYFKEAFGDNFQAYYDTEPPYDDVTTAWYLEEQMGLERLAEEIYVHGNPLVVAFGRQVNNQIVYEELWSEDFRMREPDKRFMFVRSCSTMDCQNYPDCIGHTIANSDKTLATIGNGKMGNFISWELFYGAVGKNMAIEDAVLYWLNHAIDINGIDTVYQWMGGLVYVGMPFIFRTSEFPTVEELTFRTVDPEGNILPINGVMNFSTMQDKEWEAVITDGISVNRADYSHSSDPITIISTLYFLGYEYTQTKTSCAGIISEGQKCTIDMVYQKVPDLEESFSIRFTDRNDGLFIPLNFSLEVYLTRIYDGLVSKVIIPVVNGEGYINGDFIQDPHQISFTPPVIMNYELAAIYCDCAFILNNGTNCDLWFLYEQTTPIKKETVTMKLVDEQGSAISYNGEILSSVGSTTFEVIVVDGLGILVGDLTDSSQPFSVTAPSVDGYDLVGVENNCGGTIVDGENCVITIMYKDLDIEPPPPIPKNEEITLRMDDEQGAVISYNGMVLLSVGGHPIEVMLIGGIGIVAGNLTDSSQPVSVTPPSVDGYDYIGVEDNCGGIITDGGSCVITIRYKAQDIEPPPPIPQDERITLQMMDEQGSVIIHNGTVLLSVGDNPIEVMIIGGIGIVVSDLTDSSQPVSVTPPSVDGYDLVGVEDNCGGIIVDGGSCVITIRYKAQAIEPPVPPYDLSISLAGYGLKPNKKGEVIGIIAIFYIGYQGDLPKSGKFQVAYYLDGKLLFTKTYGSLKDHRIKTVNLKIRLPKGYAGAMEVRAVVDPSNLKQETDETNNTAIGPKQ